MSLRLIVMRHAKSSWDDPLLDDFDRVLNARGKVDAANIGAWLKAQGHIPDTALVSSAQRTQATFACLNSEADITLQDALYLASSDRLLQQLRQVQGNTVLLLAHNPGIGDFAQRFARQLPQHPDFFRYPTCATTVFDVAAETWADVRFGQNDSVDFCVPRDLRD